MEPRHVEERVVEVFRLVLELFEYGGDSSVFYGVAVYRPGRITVVKLYQADGAFRVEQPVPLEAAVRLGVYSYFGHFFRPPQAFFGARFGVNVGVMVARRFISTMLLPYTLGVWFR